MDSTYSLKSWFSIGLPSFSVSLKLKNWNISIPSKLVYLFAAASALKASMFLSGLMCKAWSKLNASENSKLVRGDTKEDFFTKWAVVLGADTPIGSAFALELAKRNFSLVLIGEHMPKLEEQASLYMNQYEVKVHLLRITVLVDRNLDKLTEELSIVIRAVDVSLLVNCYGIVTPVKEFRKFQSEDLLGLMYKQMIVPSMVMKAVLNRMTAVGKSGSVINLTTTLMFCPHPMYHAYGGALAYLDYLSRALYGDYKKQGVHIHSLRYSLKSETPENLSAFVVGTLARVGSGPILRVLS